MPREKNLSQIHLYEQISKEHPQLFQTSNIFITHILSPSTDRHEKQKESNHPKVSVIYAIQDNKSNKTRVARIKQSWRNITYLKTGYMLNKDGRSTSLEKWMPELDAENPSIMQRSFSIKRGEFTIPEKTQTQIITPRIDKALQSMFYHLSKSGDSEFMDEEFLRFKHKGKPVYIPAAEIINSLILHRKDTVTKFALQPNASENLYTTLEKQDDGSYDLYLGPNVKSIECKVIFFLLKNDYTKSIYNNIYLHWHRTGHLPAALPLESPIDMYARYYERDGGILILQIANSDVLSQNIQGETVRYLHPRSRKAKENGNPSDGDGEGNGGKPSDTSDEMNSEEGTDPESLPVEIIDDLEIKVPAHLERKWRADIKIEKKESTEEKSKRKPNALPDPEEEKDLSPNDGNSKGGGATKANPANNDDDVGHNIDIVETYTEVFVQRNCTVETYANHINDLKKENGKKKKRAEAYSDAAKKNARSFMLYRIGCTETTFFMIDVEYRHYKGLKANADGSFTKSTRPGVLVIASNVSMEKFKEQYLEGLLKDLVLNSGSWGKSKKPPTGTAPHFQKTSIFADKAIGRAMFLHLESDKNQS